MSSVTKLKETSHKNDISQVYELATKHNFKVVFNELKVEGPCHMRRTFTDEIKVGKLTAEGQASSKQKAKAQAGSVMLERLKSLPLPDSLQQPPTCETTRVSTTGVALKTFPEGPQGLKPLQANIKRYNVFTRLFIMRICSFTQMYYSFIYFYCLLLY